MAVPKQLQERIHTAMQAMLADRNHQLRPIYRRRIYQTIHDLHGKQARIIRGHLAILVVRHVLPLWDRVRSYVPVPRQLLATAEGVLKGTVTPEEAATILRSRHYDHDFSYGDDVPIGNAYFVLRAAVEAVAEPLGNTLGFDAVTITEDQTDRDLDEWCTDTAGWGAMAQAGALWDEDSDPLLRRAFWLWWLNEAIPEVYREYRQ